MNDKYNFKDLIELKKNCAELKEVSDEINNFIEFKGGSQHDIDSINYFIKQKKKYNLSINCSYILSFIIIFYLIINKINRQIVKKNILIGGTNHTSIITNIYNYSKETLKKLYINIPNKKQILIVSIIIIILILFLSSKYISLYCAGCSKGSWYYSCWNNTGYNSTSCKMYRTTHNTIEHVVNVSIDASNVVNKSIKETIKTIKDAKKEIFNTYNLIRNVVTRVPFPRVKIPDVNFSCGFGIKGAKIDVCSAISKILNVPINLINKILQGSIGSIIKGFKIFFNQLKKVAKLILKNIIKSLGEILVPFHNLLGLIMDVKKTFEFMVFTIKKLGFINIIIFNIISFIKTIFPIKNIGVLLSISVFAFIFGIVIPIIGGLWAFIRFKIYLFMKSIDWIIYLINLNYELINKIFGNISEFPQTASMWEPPY